MAKRSRRKKNKEFVFPQDKRVRSHGSNPFAVLLGSLSAVGIALALWYYMFKLPAIEAARFESDSNYESVDPTQSDPTGLGLKNVNELCQLLREHNGKAMPEKTVDQGKWQQKRIQLANLIESKKPTDQQLEEAITARLMGVSETYSLVFLNGLDPNDFEIPPDPVGDTIRTELPEKLSELATLIQYQSKAFETINASKELDVDGMTKLIVGMSNDLDEDLAVPNTNSIVEYCFDKYQAVEVKQLIGFLKKHFQPATPATEGLINELIDEVVLREKGYRKLFKDKWDDGGVGQQALLNCSLELVSDPKSGIRIMSNVDQVAHWFEKDEQYDFAARIYKQMYDSAGQNMNPTAAELAKYMAHGGLVRTQLIGNRLDWECEDALGKKLASDQFNNKVVVVIFWSNFDQKSVDALTNLYIDSEKWHSSHIEFVGVCVDSKVPEEFLKLSKKLKRFELVCGDITKGNRNYILDQCPSERVPRAILVGKNGLVTHTNLPIGQVKTETRYQAHRKND